MTGTDICPICGQAMCYHTPTAGGQMCPMGGRVTYRGGVQWSETNSDPFAALRYDIARVTIERDAAITELAQVTKERDELRRDLERATNSANLHYAGRVDAGVELRDAYAELEQVTKERNELREIIGETEGLDRVGNKDSVHARMALTYLLHYLFVVVRWGSPLPYFPWIQNYLLTYWPKEPSEFEYNKKPLYYLYRALGSVQDEIDATQEGANK